jgi:hypothetical protein
MAPAEAPPPAGVEPAARWTVRIDEDYDAVDNVPAGLGSAAPQWIPLDPARTGQPPPDSSTPDHESEGRPLGISEPEPGPVWGLRFHPLEPGPPSPPEPGPPSALRAEPDRSQYPIPPAIADDPADAASGPVPTWAFRAPAAPARAPGEAVGDLTLDPMSLRRRVTVRSGASALTVDETRLVLRSWWRRREIPWPEIAGFEPRFEGTDGRGSRLVALTAAGPLELPATRRPPADLRYLAALLDAYRQRALILAGR